MRAFTYSRQSLDLAEGIDRQQERTRQLAAQRGYTIVHEYTDNDVSATKSRAKAQWPRMLAALEAGEADVVIAVDIDRLVRSLRDMLSLMDTGAAVLTVDGELDLTTADGQFRASMMASLARFETSRKSERQVRANDYRVSVGKPNPQRRRYGYESDMRTPRETEAAVVVRVFEAVAARKSLRSIAQALNADGITTATGKEWVPVRLREMVLRPYEAGFTYRGETIASADVVPIVSAELAGIARAVLADPTRRTTPGPTVRHMVSGLVFCGVCGDAMVYASTYRCKANSSHPSIIKKTLEPIVVREVARAVVTYTGEVRDGGRTDIRDLVAQHAVTEERVAAIVRDRDEGLVSAPVARARLVELRDEREAIEAKLETARSSSSTLVTLHGLAQRLQGGQIDAVSARFLELELGEQRELIRQLLNVTVNRGRGAERVDVEHLEAVWLNFGGEVANDD
ncbi:recombinase family protein [Cryobacterium sp. TmT2-59]|uniref:recombinase family protein n=1 Tax=Cryobacterium sp. TmT2-59 TaxID=1259264 RepID=UPI00106C1730|nr:recombinase family protein [Cryobacterium sp. TmT2-59]TFC87500.1 recombinase family protein [Cryobacterium sp. TmT2-59]